MSLLISPLTRCRLFPAFLFALLTILPLSALPVEPSFNASLREGAREVTPKPPFYRLQTVIIDAGHGGKDPGGMGANSREKHIALSIATFLADHIRAAYPQIRVIMTRADDTFIPLYERAAIANRNQADLFISIHANIMPGSKATYGTETFVMGQHVAKHNLNVAKRENAAILLEADYETNYDYDPNSEEGHILMSMFQNAFLEQSILFAELVEDQFATTAKRKSRGVKQAGFVVLKETTMPSVLVETGFMSNPREEAYLLSEAGQRTLANAIFQAFVSYRNIVEADDTTIPVASTVALEPVSSLSPNRLRKDLSKRDGTALADREVNPSASPLIKEATPPPPITSSPIVTATNERDTRVASNRSVATSPPTRNDRMPVLGQEVAERSIPSPTAYASNLSTKGPAPSPARPSVLEREVEAPPGTTAPPTNAVIPAVYQPDPNTPLATYQPPAVTPVATQEVAMPTSPASPELIFAVQLAAAGRKLAQTEARWKELRYPLEVVREGGLFKYQARGILDAQTAKSAQQELLSAGFIGAFIVVYRGDERLGPSETQRILQK